jgi:hypothetical protein
MGNRDNILHVQIGFSVVGIERWLGQIGCAIFGIDQDD